MLPDTANRVVLVVDDSDDDRGFVREALGLVAPELRIVEARDGVEALEFLRRPDVMFPDFVLLDLKMPRKDGLETLADIRADQTLRHLPVIAAFTTATDPEFVRRAYAAGANAYIGKPSSLQGLRMVMAAIVHHWFTIATLPPRMTGREAPVGTDPTQADRSADPPTGWTASPRASAP